MAPVNTTDPLAQLRDIHLPDPVSWWPPAPGWWVLAAGVAIIIAWLIRWSLQRHRARRYRKLAAIELEQIFQREQSPQRQLEDVCQLLKRVALFAFPRENVASVHGHQWLTFLSASAPAVALPTEVETLFQQRYQDIEPEAKAMATLRQYCQQWLRQHIASNRPEVSVAER